MENEIGMVIQMCRKHCNLEQAYVAYKLGITVVSYSNIENGGVDLDIEKLYHLSRLFGIRAHQILALAEEVAEFGEYNWLPSVIKAMIRPIPSTAK